MNAKEKNQKKRDRGDAELEAMGYGLINIFKSIIAGAKELKKSRAKCVIFFIAIAAAAVAFAWRQEIIAFTGIEERFHIVKLAIYAMPALPFLILFAYGAGRGNEKDEYQKKFEEIGFCGKGKLYPEFLAKNQDGKVVILTFRSPGISINEWKNRKVDLETALDCNIIKTHTSKKSKKIVILHTVPTENGLSNDLPWSNEYISEKDFELIVGRELLYNVIFDLNKVPHGLIAGVTGSGKSVLLRCMLWQCIFKGAKVYMIDFKGGVEFGTEYEHFGDVITERQDAVEMLKMLTAENALRLKVFRQVGVKNITEYNRKFPDKALCRIVLVCDEVAEMLDKTGLGKAEKEVFSQIEKEMSTLARLSRAPGINMLLATQRPDAKVIPGQIKNNLPIRISGRMPDEQNSQMVLGNSKACNLDDTRGRFMYTIGSDTYEFQAYYFNDAAVVKGNYIKGEMLLNKCNEEFTDEAINEMEAEYEDDLESGWDPMQEGEWADEDSDFDEFEGFDG